MSLGVVVSAGEGGLSFVLLLLISRSTDRKQIASSNPRRAKSVVRSIIARAHFFQQRLGRAGRLLNASPRQPGGRQGLRDGWHEARKIGDVWVSRQGPHVIKA